MDINLLTFVLVKYGLTTLSVVTVMLFQYARVRYLNFPVGYLLYYFAGIFALVVAWEILLICTHLFVGTGCG